MDVEKRKTAVVKLCERMIEVSRSYLEVQNNEEVAN